MTPVADPRPAEHCPKCGGMFMCPCRVFKTSPASPSAHLSIDERITAAFDRCAELERLLARRVDLLTINPDRCKEWMNDKYAATIPMNLWREVLEAGRISLLDSLNLQIEEKLAALEPHSSAPSVKTEDSVASVTNIPALPFLPDGGELLKESLPVVGMMSIDDIARITEQCDLEMESRFASLIPTSEQKEATPNL